MIFQDPYGSLDPRQQPLDAVAEAVHQWRRTSKSASRAEALDLLRSVSITERQATSGLRALSGGQRQRVSIARALAPRPQVLVADEPTSSLDQSAQAAILNLLRRIQAERGLSIIFISHDLALVRYLTETVHVMKDGNVVEQGVDRPGPQPAAPRVHAAADRVGPGVAAAPPPPAAAFPGRHRFRRYRAERFLPGIGTCA